MSAINKRFNGSGLSDLLVAAKVIAEGSVDNAVKGKHYKRGVQCFHLMYEVLVRRIIQQELNEGLSLSAELKEKLEKLQKPTASTQEQRKIISDELESSPEFSFFVIQAFQKAENSDSPMAKYWLTFLDMSEILMLNIHAVKTQNWEEFKTSLRLMLPWLQVYDSDKYGRWLVEFWLEISCLPEEKAQYMHDSLFAQSMTGKPYSCLPLDLWIEVTMNKGSKMKAGWLRILKNEQMLPSSVRNANLINTIRACLHAIANMEETSICHAENSTSRLKIDEQAVQDLNNCINEFDCDPFDLTKPTLRSLQSGMIASEELVQDFETAHDDGEMLVKNFFDKRMFSAEKSFDATISRNARGNFNRPPAVEIGPKASVSRTAVMENKAMAEVISLVQNSDVKINLVQIWNIISQRNAFQYSTPMVPWSKCRNRNWLKN